MADGLFHGMLPARRVSFKKEDPMRKRPKKKAMRKLNAALATSAEAVIVVRQ